jgi:3-oxoacyl-[acyl-carrier protein] reductase
VIRTSLGGAYNLCRAALPAMRANGFGRIVVVSSVIGMIGFPGDSAYASAKAGLFGFVRALAKEVGRDGITVNAIAPGFVETEMTSAVSGGARDLMLRRTILRRPGKPSEIASAARFLTCEGDYVTGQTIVVDGGMML